jgi:hypothetical protein
MSMTTSLRAAFENKKPSRGSFRAINSYFFVQLFEFYLVTQTLLKSKVSQNLL